jgi:pimeloyl-ACP methyl ester carboxylesterase
MCPPAPPPATCPIGWQPEALAPVFFGARSLGPAEGAPVPLRLFFPSLDGAVETAPLLEGCGRYPLVLFAHGQCFNDADHYRRWFRTPAQLARAGYVVAVPFLADNASGTNPSVSTHTDEATLDAVLTWARTGWEHASVLMPPPATAVIGHSFGAMLGARFAVGRQIAAYSGLSGRWGDWFGDEPFPLPLLNMPSLMVWGESELLTQLTDAQWEAMARPRHRVVFPEGDHWDYLGSNLPPCAAAGGPCPQIGAATADLLTMFLGRYVPPEFATDLPERIPASLEPPQLVLTPQQEFFAGGYLNGFGALGGNPACTIEQTSAVERLVANTRSRETHSLDRPCAWVSKIASRHRRVVTAKPAGFHWCDFCFRSRADG